MKKKRINHGLKKNSFLEEAVSFPGNSILLGTVLKPKSSFSLKKFTYLIFLARYRWKKCTHILFTKVTGKYTLAWFNFNVTPLCRSAIPCKCIS